MIKEIKYLLLMASGLVFAGCGQGEVSFANDVQPIVNTHCIRCHAGAGEGAEMSGYVMLDYDSVMRGTQYGPVVVPGSRMSSALYLVIAGETAPEIRMPPHTDESFAEGRGFKLSDDAVETIGLWIDQGANDN